MRQPLSVEFINNNMSSLSLAISDPIFVYSTVAFLFLLILTVIVQDRNSFIFCVLLLFLYFCFIVYLLLTRNKAPAKQNVHSLEEFHATDKRPKILQNFQRQAQSILRQIKTQFHSPEQLNASSYYSPASYFPTQLTSVSRRNIETNIKLGSYGNSSFWRRQLKQIQDTFIENMKEQQQNNSQYRNALKYFGVVSQNKQKLQRLIEQYLMDLTATQVDLTEPKINQANRILSKHFGINLTNGLSSFSHEINLEQFKSLVSFYSRHKILPNKYTSKYSQEVLNEDMKNLNIIYNQIFYIICYSEEQKSLNLLTRILNQYFPSLPIIVNKVSKINSDKKQLILNIYPDFTASWSSYHTYRTKNVHRLCIVYLLSLLKYKMQVDKKIIKLVKYYVA